MTQPTARKQAEIWQRRFLRELDACETVEEWAELIAENGDNLGFCAQHDPSGYVTVKIAIDMKQREFPTCPPPVTTSSASSSRESPEPGSTPTTSTANDPPSETE